jgi:hypothetical protein
MAKIDEERILVRVSLLIRDTASVGNITIVSPQLIQDVEEYVANQIATNFTGIEGIIVEARDATSWSITVPPLVPTYSVSPSVTTVAEGNSVVFSITTTAVDDATTLYWTVLGHSANLANIDFGGNLNSGSVTINDNSGNITLTPVADGTVETNEIFALQLRTVSIGGNVVATSANVTITD